VSNHREQDDKRRIHGSWDPTDSCLSLCVRIVSFEMDGNEFSAIRHYLAKSQIQMARLLGVSSKAVQSFEQEWRKVPAHCERQLLFLLYLNRIPRDSDKPCWKIRKCRPETRRECIAWEVKAGQLCWFINGTICDGKVQENWNQKMQFCRQCDAFRSLFTFNDAVLFCTLRTSAGGKPRL
jgi:hypothetical protein